MIYNQQLARVKNDKKSVNYDKKSVSVTKSPSYPQGRDICKSVIVDGQCVMMTLSLMSQVRYE